MYKISLRRVTQVAKGRGMGKTWLLKGVRCGVLSPFSFTDNSEVQCLDQARPAKTADIVEVRRGNMT